MDNIKKVRIMSEVSKVVSDRDRARLQLKEYVIELAAARGQEDDVMDKLIFKVNEAFDVLLNSHVEMVLSLGESLSDETHENFMYEASDERDEAVEEAEEGKVKAKEIIKEKTIAEESIKVDNLGLMGKKDREEFVIQELKISRKVSQEVAENELSCMFSTWENLQDAHPNASLQGGVVPHEASRALNRTNLFKQKLPSIPEEIFDGGSAASGTENLYGAPGQNPCAGSCYITTKTTSQEQRLEGERAAATPEHVLQAPGHEDGGDTRQSCHIQRGRENASVEASSTRQDLKSLSVHDPEIFLHCPKLVSAAVKGENPQTDVTCSEDFNEFASHPRGLEESRVGVGSTLRSGGLIGSSYQKGWRATLMDVNTRGATGESLSDHTALDENTSGVHEGVLHKIQMVPEHVVTTGLDSSDARMYAQALEYAKDTVLEKVKSQVKVRIERRLEGRATQILDEWYDLHEEFEKLVPVPARKKVPPNREIEIIDIGSSADEEGPDEPVLPEPVPARRPQEEVVAIKTRKREQGGIQGSSRTTRKGESQYYPGRLIDRLRKLARRKPEAVPAFMKEFRENYLGGKREPISKQTEREDPPQRSSKD